MDDYGSSSFTTLLPRIVFDLLILSMASSALLDVWFQGSLFSSYRSWLEARGELERGWWARLLTCRFCSSYSLPWLLSLLFLLPAWLLDHHRMAYAGLLPRLPLMLLSVTWLLTRPVIAAPSLANPPHSDVQENTPVTPSVGVQDER